jgi:hypothetical protein
MLFPYQQLIWQSLNEVCEHGYTSWVKKDGVSIHYNPSNYKKYKELFDEELKEYDDNDPSRHFVRIHIPYKDIFGKPWTPSRIEYWGEMSFEVFTGSDFSFKKSMDLTQWQSCSGPECSAPSYEEMIIKLCKQFFKNYGKKLDDDYLTKEEKDNHEKEWPFHMDRETEDKKGFYMDHNPKYIQVTEAELNRRWLKDFVKTEYGKKHWADSFDEQLKG